MKNNNKDKQFAQIYSQNFVSIYRYIFVRLYNKERAEDLASKAFVTAYEKFKTNQEIISNPKAWLFQIARFTMSNYIRKKKDLRLDKDFDIASNDESVEKLRITKDEFKMVKRMLKRLDPDTREILTLRIWEELKFKEIADLVGLKKEAVEKRYYRGIQKIRERIKDKDRQIMPVVLVGLQQLSANDLFVPSRNLAKEILSKLGPSLMKFIKINSIKNMDKVITLFGKTIVVKKLVIVGISSLVGLSVVGGGAYLVATDKLKVKGDKVEEVEFEVTEDDSVPVEEGIDDEIKTKICESEKLGLKMEVPEDWRCEGRVVEPKTPKDLDVEFFVESEFYILKFSKNFIEFPSYDEEKVIYTNDLQILKRLTSEFASLIYGEVNNSDIWFLVEYPDYENKDLTDQEMEELRVVLDSLEVVESKKKQVSVEGGRSITVIEEGDYNNDLNDEIYWKTYTYRCVEFEPNNVVFYYHSDWGMETPQIPFPKDDYDHSFKKDNMVIYLDMIDDSTWKDLNNSQVAIKWVKDIDEFQYHTISQLANWVQDERHFSLFRVEGVGGEYFMAVINAVDFKPAVSPQEEWPIYFILKTENVSQEQKESLEEMLDKVEIY